VGYADTTGVHQWVRGVPLVVQHGTRNSGESNFVSVVGDSGHHTGANSPRVKHTIWQLRCRGRRWAEAQNIGACDGKMRCTKNISNNTTNPCIRSTKRFDCTWMIVCLTLQGNSGAFDERNNSRITHERTHHKRSINGTRGVSELIDERLNNLSRFCSDARAKSLVCTMLAPRLGDCFKFNVACPTSLIVVAQRTQFFHVKSQPTLYVEHPKLIITGIQCKWDQLKECLFHRWSRGHNGHDERVNGPALDHRIRQ